MTDACVTSIAGGHLYDYPQYYDLVFGVGTSGECDFLQGCFDLHARRRVKRVFEPACGSGRLLIKLAQRGLDVSGCDLNRPSVDYCNRRFKRRGLRPAAFVADIATISLPLKVDAAFNLLSSFQLLPNEHEAERHLAAMARSLARGGLYIVGLHLMPSEGRRISAERWTATRGRLSVCCRIWTRQLHRRRRQERCVMLSEIKTPGTRLRIEEELRFRTYSALQLQRLFRKVREFDAVAIYDFTYDLFDPISVGPETQDVVYVLRRR